jgi:hypothetical protein
MSFAGNGSEHERRDPGSGTQLTEEALKVNGKRGVNPPLPTQL